MSLSRAQPSLSVLRWLTTKCNCTLCILLMMLSVGNSWPLPIVSRRNRKVELSNLTKSLDGILKNEECSLWANNINMCLWNNVSITLSAALVCRWQKTISAEDFVFWAEIYYFVCVMLRWVITHPLSHSTWTRFLWIELLPADSGATRVSRGSFASAN